MCDLKRENLDLSDKSCHLKRENLHLNCKRCHPKRRSFDANCEKPQHFSENNPEQPAGNRFGVRMVAALVCGATASAEWSRQVAKSKPGSDLDL